MDNTQVGFNRVSILEGQEDSPEGSFLVDSLVVNFLEGSLEDSLEDFQVVNIPVDSLVGSPVVNILVSIQVVNLVASFPVEFLNSHNNLSSHHRSSLHHSGHNNPNNPNSLL